VARSTQKYIVRNPEIQEEKKAEKKAREKREVRGFYL
jgi:hypothetical protein